MATHQIARGIAQLGRHGDSTLVHMQPEEVAGLQALARSQGTSLSINPHTGLPEAFSLGGFFSSLAPTLAGLGVAMIPGMQPYALQAGIAAGAATGALTNKKNPLMGAVMGGMGGYGGANIATGLGATSAAQAGANVADPLVQDQLKNLTMQGGGAGMGEIGGANLMSNTGATAQTASTAGSAFQSNPFHVGLTPDAQTSQLMAGNTIESTGIVPGGYGATAQPPSFMGNLSTAGQNAGDILTGKEGAWNAFKENLGGGAGAVSNTKGLMTAGLPLAGGVLGGLEASDIYGNPIIPTKKVIPTLNLSDESLPALNLNTNYPTYAQGGPVSFADGGDAMKGGGPDAMQGASLPSLTDQNTVQYYTPQPYMATPNNGMAGMYAAIQALQAGDKKAAEKALLDGALSVGQFAPGTIAIRPENTAATAAEGLNLGVANNGVEPQGLGSLGSTALTAETAKTANDEGYAVGGSISGGGTIASGGLQDLYSSSDSTVPEQLSRDGYGLGRLQAMADGGVAGYADGGLAAARGGRQQNNPKKMFTPAVSPGSAPNQQFNTPTDLSGIVSLPASSTPARGWSSMFRGLNFPAKNNAPVNQSSLYTNAGPTNLTNNNTNSNLYTPSTPSTPSMNNYLGDPSLYSTANNSNLYSNTMGYAEGGYLDGPGDGMSDSIPATIEGKQPARLADGEFVIPADVVSHLGNGSTKAGSKHLYNMLDKVRKARTGSKKQGKQINPNKFMPA